MSPIDENVPKVKKLQTEGNQAFREENQAFYEVNYASPEKANKSEEVTGALAEQNEKEHEGNASELGMKHSSFEENDPKETARTIARTRWRTNQNAEGTNCIDKHDRISANDQTGEEVSGRRSFSGYGDDSEYSTSPHQTNNNAKAKNQKWVPQVPLPDPGSYYSQNFEDSFNYNADEIEARIDQRNAETLAATKNMVALMDESREAGYRTQGNLHNQGERLKGVERDMDRMGSLFDEAEADLDEMEGKGGCCGVKKKKRRRKEEGKKKSKKIKYKGVGEVDEVQAKDEGGNFHYVTGDHRERQMAANLEMVDDILDEMDFLADDLNAEIKGQNKRIDRIQAKGKQNQEQLNRVNAKAERIANGTKAPESPRGTGGLAAAAMGM